MEKEKKEVKEVSQELKRKTESEIAHLREELARLKALKRQKEQIEHLSSQEAQIEKEKLLPEQSIKEPTETLTQQSTVENVEKPPQQNAEETTETLTQQGKGNYEKIEGRLKNIEQYLSGQLTLEDPKIYGKGSEYVESQLQVLEEEIIGETGLIEKELSPYEKLKKDYPWLEEPRYEFMYSVPNKKKNPTDYQSWKEEWGKVLFDYSRYAILHILYLRQLYIEKPFSNFQNRKVAIEEIIDELIDQELAKWLTKGKDKVRIYWKTLDLWAEEIYDWAIELGKLEPILIYEIREANEDFSTLPVEDIEEVFKMLSKDKKAIIIKLDDGQPALKLEI